MALSPVLVLAVDGAGLVEDEGKAWGVFRPIGVRGPRGRPGTRPLVVGSGRLLLQ